MAARSGCFADCCRQLRVPWYVYFSHGTANWERCAGRIGKATRAGSGTSRFAHVGGEVMAKKEDFKIEFDIGTIKHLGLRMYSTLPPAVGELVANAWDADAERVDITIPTTVFTQDSEIVIEDNGAGMDDKQVRE